MRKSSRLSLLVVLLLLAAVVSAGIWLAGNSDPTAAAGQSKRPGTAPSRLVNQQPLQTAEQLEKMATTRDEARLARDAINTADHAVDLAFTTALRDARNHPAEENADTKALRARVRTLQNQVEQANELVAQLSSSLATSRGEETDVLQQRLLLASAELALRRDELEDARNNLMRAGGDPESWIKRLLERHQAVQHGDSAQPLAFWLKPVFAVPGNAAAQTRLWVQLRAKRKQLLDAQRQTSATALELSRKHQEVESRLAQISRSNVSGSGSQAARVAAIDRQAEDRKTLSEYGVRIQDMQQLAQIYADWAGVISAQMLACVRAILQGLLWIIVICMVAVIGNMGVDKLASQAGANRRRQATMRLVGRFVVQGTGVVLIIFVLFGSPSQLSTIIALAGAGLTVVLKDFIVAFFGWFILMGNSGIRIGDWVEINGIMGEVVDIGLLRTTLLETGNWAESGHPTGRRVSFVNSFAIEGHFFNFSTTGQWLWDTMEIQVPAGLDPYSTMDAVLQLVRNETESAARVAAEEWRHATRGSVKEVSAEPAINLCPKPGGIAIVVRYITRANERFGLRSRIYQAVVDLLHQRQAGVVQAVPKATVA